MVQPGTILLDKYRVEQILGKGGMGVVVAAEHIELRQRVAIKMLAPEIGQRADVAERFVREARAAVRLKSEHVARVTDVGRLPDGAPYMIMEMLEGMDLEHVLRQRGALPPGEAVDYVLQICEAMAEAHALGIIHRDLKPANCFVTRRPDGSPLVKVLDFGISKALDDKSHQLTASNSMLGTPDYMSPEQLRDSSSVDARTDLWALGVILYEALSGQRPFGAAELGGLVVAIVTEPARPLTVELPSALAEIVARCLEKDPAARFQDVAELTSELVPFSASGGASASVIDRVHGILRRGSEPIPRTGPMVTVATSPGVPAVAPRTTLGSSTGEIEPSGRRSKKIWIGAAGAGAVAVGAIVAFGLIRSGGGSPAAPPVAARPASAPAAPTAVPAPATAAPAPAPAPAPSPEAVGSATAPSETPSTTTPSVAQPSTKPTAAHHHASHAVAKPKPVLELDKHGMPIQR